MRVAILDDYQAAALTLADWSPLAGRVSISVFSDHLNDEETRFESITSLSLCTMRRPVTAMSEAWLRRKVRHH